jgi:glycosyltransferase involved in cell wall biosynthesis
MIAYANYYTDARIKNYVDALLKTGYEVDVFALGNSEPTRPGLRVFCLMPKIWSGNVLPYILSQCWFLLMVVFRAGAAFFRRRYRVVHVHNMPDFIIFGALIPKIFGAKVILDVHDTMPEAYATKFDLPLSHILVKLLRFEERLSAAFADHVITTNDFHKEALVEHGIPASKISITMNVGNENIFRPQISVYKGDGLVLAYHGTVAERLGLNLILEAIRLARPDCPQLRFILIGDGDYMPTIRTLIAEYHLSDIVSLEGWVPVEDSPRYLSKAQVGIVGNRLSTEAKKNWMLPVKMLEYAAMEIPTIAPSLRVITHYFDKDSVFYYTPDDAEDMARCIVDIYQHPEKIEAAKLNLRNFNRQYNWGVMKGHYLKLVDDLQGNRRKPKPIQ